MSAPNFWEALPLGPGVKLIRHDANGIAALDKPPGIRSHPNEAGADERSLLTCSYNFETESFSWSAPSGATFRLWLLNRLDAGTSGVVLASANEKLAASIKLQFAKKTIAKLYVALVFGNAPVGRQVWRDRLSVEKRGGQIRTKAVGHIPAESLYQLLRAAPTTPRLSLIQLEPKTGRSHQLRVQSAKRSLPIVGDATYGDFKANRDFARRYKTKRLFLHSSETRFDYELAGKVVSFSAKSELPADFTAAFG